MPDDLLERQINQLIEHGRADRNMPDRNLIDHLEGATQMLFV